MTGKVPPTLLQRINPGCGPTLQCLRFILIPGTLRLLIAWSELLCGSVLDVESHPSCSRWINTPINYHDFEPFNVTFKVGNISVCNGCRNKFSESDKIVIQHQEFRNFTNPHTQLHASKYGNAYYHAQRKCIEIKWGQAFNIIIPDDIKEKLLPNQKDHRQLQFAVM